MIQIDETKKPQAPENINLKESEEEAIPVSQRRNIYKVKHIHWRIRTALPYLNTAPLIKILGELSSDFSASFTEQEAKFFEFVQMLFETGKLPRIFALILEPANTNPVRALLNKFWIRHYKVNAENIIDSMTDEDWRPIVADFFIIGSQWIASWLHSSGLFGSESSEKKSDSSEPSLMRMILKPLMNPLQTRSSSSMPQGDSTANMKSSAAVTN